MKRRHDDLDLPPTELALFTAFCDLQVAHRLQSQALDAVWRQLAQARHTRARRPGSEGQITLLYGPTGVGKTALWLACMERCRALHVQRGLTGLLPYLYTLCDVPTSGVWQMKPFFENALTAADEVLIGQKQLIRPVTVAQSSWQATTAGLRQATLNVLKNRQPPVFCIDEAHHLGIHSSDEQKDKNLDAIKTFADEAPVPILMIGSYELIDFHSRSGRLGRRTVPFHLPRYDIEKEDDQFEYLSAVNFFAERLPRGGVDLYAQGLDFMEQTLGCVGLLKQWLERAYFAALWAGRREIRTVDLQEVAPSAELVAQWLEEINVGEARLRESRRPSSTADARVSKTTARTKTKKKSPTRKLFQRTVGEDPVGAARTTKVAA